MTKQKSLSFDAAIWVIFLIITSTTAFALLQRDKNRHFGAVSYGAFPQFSLKSTQGSFFDDHRMKSQVWLIHTAPSAAQAMAIAKRLSEIEQSTASGKRHASILTFSGENAVLLKSLLPSHYIVVGSPQEMATIFSFSKNMDENNVLLVDQNGIIRGQYNMNDVDDYRSLQQNLMRLL